MKLPLACEHKVGHLHLTAPQCDSQQEDGCLHRCLTLHTSPLPPLLSMYLKYPCLSGLSVGVRWLASTRCKWTTVRCFTESPLSIQVISANYCKLLADETISPRCEEHISQLTNTLADSEERQMQFSARFQSHIVFLALSRGQAVLQFNPHKSSHSGLYWIKGSIPACSSSVTYPDLQGLQWKPTTTPAPPASSKLKWRTPSQ